MGSFYFDEKLLNVVRFYEGIIIIKLKRVCCIISTTINDYQSLI